MSGTSVAILMVSLALGAAVIIGTMRRSRMGINIRRADCPNCGHQLPLVRRPRNMRQFLWGGTTCPNCGTEVDKWGRRVDPA